MNKREMTDFVCKKYETIIARDTNELEDKLTAIRQNRIKSLNELSEYFRRVFIDDAIARGFYSDDLKKEKSVVSLPEIRYSSDARRFIKKSDEELSLEKEIKEINRTLNKEKEEVLENILILGIKDPSVKEALINLSKRAKGE